MKAVRIYKHGGTENLIIEIWDSRSKEACKANMGGGVENFCVTLTSNNLRFTVSLEVDYFRLRCGKKGRVISDPASGDSLANSVSVTRHSYFLDTALTKSWAVVTQPKRASTFQSAPCCVKGGPALLVASDITIGQYSRK